jgi:hypothetical protein
MKKQETSEILHQLVFLSNFKIKSMKQLFTFFTILFANTINLFAQAPPQGINYQAVIYMDGNDSQPGTNISGQLLVNQNITVQFSILKSSITGPIVYKEIHHVETDEFGMFSLIIGQGNAIGTSAFPAIDWASDNYFLNVELDKKAGTDFKIMSTQQLWSVPYSLYSGESSYAGTAGNGISTISDNGNGTITITNVDGSSYTSPILSGLTGPQGIQGATGDNGLNALAKTTSEGAGINCTTGGLKIEYGLDANSNGILDASEINVTLTKYVCNGEQGTPGSQNTWSLTGNTGTSLSTNFIGTTDAQDWIIKTNNLERLRVNSEGNIGIGTNNPQAKLVINGDSGSGSGVDSSIVFTAIGNVGIGQPSPLYKLDIGTSDNFNWAARIQNAGGSGNGLLIKSGAPTSNVPVFEIQNNASTPIVSVRANNLFGIGTSNPLGKFHVNNDISGSDSSFVVTTDGKVGIGTSSPTDKVVIQDGGMRINGKFGIGFNDDPYANNVANGWEGAKIYWEEGTINSAAPQSDYLVIEKKDGNSTSPDGGIAFANRGNNGLRSTTMVISGLGNVGIGTIAPARSLHINAVIRLEPIPSSPSSPSKGDIYFDSTINKLRVFDGTVWQNCW